MSELESLRASYDHIHAQLPDGSCQICKLSASLTSMTQERDAATKELAELKFRRGVMAEPDLRMANQIAALTQERDDWKDSYARDIDFVTDKSPETIAALTQERDALQAQLTSLRESLPSDREAIVEALKRAQRYFGASGDTFKAIDSAIALIESLPLPREGDE